MRSWKISNVQNANRLRAPFLCFLCVLFFVYFPQSASGANPPDAPAALVIRNATILTVSHGTIEHGSILIKDGKIAEVGQSVNAPKDAKHIDAAAQFDMPEIIASHSLIATQSTNDGS